MIFLTGLVYLIKIISYIFGVWMIFIAFGPIDETPPKLFLFGLYLLGIMMIVFAGMKWPL